jgi:major type 1 subunit fimbrin (pilin)
VVNKMKKSTWLNVLVKFTLSAMAIFSIPHTFAVVTCAVPEPIITTLPIAPQNITAGPDIPNGTVIYSGRFTQQGLVRVNCKSTTVPESGVVNKYLKIKSISMPRSSYQGAGRHEYIYETGVPGIGFAVWKGGAGVSADGPTLVSPYTINVKYASGTSTTLDSSYSFGLIKTGDISPGVINGANFPVITSALSNGNNMNMPEDATLATVAFSGVINVTSQTCTTPDVKVALGVYEKSQYFKGKGSTTVWKDASIHLTNCPRFHGYYAFGGKDIEITENGEQTIPAATANVLDLSIQPTSEIIDSANGVMAISSAGNDVAATGVGIQFGRGRVSGTPVPFNFAGPNRYTPPSDGSPTFTIPLVARYIQTEADITPGRADGKAVFTINYF